MSIPIESIDVPVSFLCVDCGRNTAPGCSTRQEVFDAIQEARRQGLLNPNTKIGVMRGGHDSELYTVNDAVWARAKMEPKGGCLCILCLELRLHRKLKRRDFPPGEPLNWFFGTSLLMQRRGYRARTDDPNLVLAYPFEQFQIDHPAEARAIEAKIDAEGGA
jgi:hypothetical protein